MAHQKGTTIPRWAEIGALAALLILGAFLRFYRLDDVPRGLCLDEVMNGSLGRDILNGRHEVYIEEAYGHEPLYHYLQAGAIRLLGFNVWGIRLPSVLCGVLFLAGVWWLARMLFGPISALVALGGLAAGWWGVFYGRAGIRAITCPLLTTASLIGFWQGMAACRGRRRWLLFGVGGLCLGLSLYTYPAARLVFWLPLLIVFYLWFSDRPALAERWRELVLFGSVALLIAAPIALYLATNREERVDQLAEPIRQLRDGNPTPVLTLTRDTLLMPLGLKGDPRYLYNLSGRPIWEWPWAVLFVAGLGVALIRWKHPAYAMLLLWLGLGLLPGMVTPDAPNTIRTIAALPAVYLLASLPAGEIIRRVRRWLVVAGVGIALSALVAFHALSTWRDMVLWAGDFETEWRYQTPLFSAAQVLDADPSDAPLCVSTPLYTGLAVSSMEAALTRDDLTVRWFLGDRALLFPGGKATCRYLYTDATQPDPMLAARWLEGYKTLESDEQRPDGRPFYRFYQLPPDAAPSIEPGAVYAGVVPNVQPLSMPVRFGDHIELVGYAWQSNEWHLDSEGVLLTVWRVLAPGDRALAIFAHLLDQEGAFVAGEDRLDVPAHTWQQRDLFVQVQRIRPPPDALPGEYWPEIGLYNRDTGGRLTVALDKEGVVDRILLAPVRLSVVDVAAE